MNTRYDPQGALGPLLQGLVFGVIAAGHLCLLAWLARVPIATHYALLALTAFVTSVAVFRRFDLFQPWDLGRTGSMGTRIFMAWLLLGGVLIVIALGTQHTSTYTFWVLIAWLLTTPLMFLLVHVAIRYALIRVFPQLVRPRSAVIVFVNPHAERLTRTLRTIITPRFDLKGFFEDRHVQRTGAFANGAPVLGGVDELLGYVNTHGVEVVFVVLPAQGAERAQTVIESLGDTTASVYYVPDFDLLDRGHMRFSDIGGIPVITLTETPFYGADGWLKRAMDILFAAVGLLCLSPFIALVALLVRLRMRTPVIFTQDRYGLDGRHIRVHKFRTMQVAENDPDVRQATRNDPRVTPLGGFLRRMSIDEWPQLWNVLIGEMSVVGPRPHAVTQNEEYRKIINGYMSRHKVKPGLTGWAQIHGLRGEIRTLSDMQHRVEYDVEYIQRWSPELDIRIILHTFWIIFHDDEAY